MCFDEHKKYKNCLSLKITMEKFGFIQSQHEQLSNHVLFNEIQ